MIFSLLGANSTFDPVLDRPDFTAVGAQLGDSGL